MGCAAGYSLQQDMDLSISHKNSQILLLNRPIKNLYQPKIIESTSFCNSLKQCDEDDNLENLFEECCKLEEELKNANTRILKKDENQVQELQQISQQKNFSQTSICMYRRRNLFRNNNKFLDKNDKIPNSILKRKRLKEGQVFSSNIQSKIKVQKVVRFSKCYIKLIPETQFSKNIINIQNQSSDDLNDNVNQQ
ncbi:unnamed protein product [Paramecium primaurelia]|uniref:Uncharacterized protein n=1 Tax=Paramecium primaurelia TaxID=5886 RepID=A0A8S1L4R4_PARPR|nr:unnamed protein product [Paramecium primaurelia]